MALREFLVKPSPIILKLYQQSAGNTVARKNQPFKVLSMEMIIVNLKKVHSIKRMMYLY